MNLITHVFQKNRLIIIRNIEKYIARHYKIIIQIEKSLSEERDFPGAKVTWQSWQIILQNSLELMNEKCFVLTSPNITSPKCNEK